MHNFKISASHCSARADLGKQEQLEVHAQRLAEKNACGKKDISGKSGGSTTRDPLKDHERLEARWSCCIVLVESAIEKFRERAPLWSSPSRYIAIASTGQRHRRNGHSKPSAEEYHCHRWTQCRRRSLALSRFLSLSVLRGSSKKEKNNFTNLGPCHSDAASCRRESGILHKLQCKRLVDLTDTRVHLEPPVISR